MFRITLLTVGKRKNGPLKDLSEEFAKRLGPYAKMEFKAVKEEPFRSDADRGRVFKEEGARIRAAMSPDAFSVLLTEHGDEFDSPGFADALLSWSENESRPLEFIIAGPLGMDPDLKKEVDATLALSRMTFPHDVAHALLLEQLYRAATILKDKAYHY